MGMSKAFGLTLGDSLSLAGELPGFLTNLRTRMPDSMRCTSVITNDLRIEFRDTVLYGQGREDRVRVETQRVHLIGDRYFLSREPAPRCRRACCEHTTLGDEC